MIHPTATRTPAAATDATPLPHDLADLCRRVARLTRLRRGERADVERELESHFREALAAGRSAPDAAAAFGDPKSAARDLRAAAIAKRSPVDRALGHALRFTCLAVAGLVLAYAGFAAYLHFRAPVISFDPLERFRTRLAAPASPDDVAWPHYRRAYLALGLGAADPEKDSPGALAAKDMPFPGDAKWADAVAWLDARSEALAVLHDAARRPVFGFPMAREWDPEDEPLVGADSMRQMREVVATRNDPRKFPMLGVLLPHLASSRAAGRMLALDATRAAEAGDGERFVADVEAAIRLSFHVQDGRLLIGDLVGTAIRHLAVQRALASLEWKPDLLDAAQLARLQKAFESMPPALRRLDLAAEGLMLEDVVQRAYTDDGAGNGTFRLDREALLPFIQSIEGVSGGQRSASGERGTAVLAATLLSGPVAAFTVADRRETSEFIDRWLRRFEAECQVELRDRKRIHETGMEFDREVNADPVRFLIPKVVMPALGGAAISMARDRAQLAAAAATCAALRWRLDHAGAWPARLEDLVPAYLPAVPEDPWSGAPARIAGEGTSFRIWSVGEDGIDDGGDPDAVDPARDEAGASTFANRGSLTDDGQPTYVGDRAKVDWVWFAPRGNADRWKPRTPRDG
jgi:hypothetical protein